MPRMTRLIGSLTLVITSLTAWMACRPTHAASANDEGQRIFRFDTFGNEKFWTDTAKMQQVVQSAVSPNLALKVGLKVDADAIPPDIAQAIKAGQVDLNSPATTVT